MSHVGCNGEKTAVHLHVSMCAYVCMCFITLVTQKVFHMPVNTTADSPDTCLMNKRTDTPINGGFFFVHVFETKKLQRTSDLPLSMNVQCQLSCLCLLFITPLSPAFLNLFTFLSTYSLPHSHLSFSASRLPLGAVVMAERAGAEMFQRNCTYTIQFILFISLRPSPTIT